jgi:indole-3-acetate monooxygenase
VQRVVDLALSATATTTRGTFRSSRLDERQVVHRFIAQADLKLRAARAFMPTTRPRT